jgi:GST-like protein
LADRCEALKRSEEYRMTYILYGDRRSGAFAVECALAESGQQYEFNIVSLEKSEQKAPEYLKLNPSGKVPALRLPDGQIVTESLALMLAIAERHPEASLLPPPSSTERVQCLRWLAFMASEIYPMIEIVDYPERFAPEAPQQLKEKAAERYRERLLVLERAIVGPWVLAHFSLADIYAVMFSRWTRRGWREANLPKLIELTRQFSQRPGIAPVWARHFG